MVVKKNDLLLYSLATGFLDVLYREVNAVLFLKKIMGEFITAINSELSAKDFDDLAILLCIKNHIIYLPFKFSKNIPQYHEGVYKLPRLFVQAGFKLNFLGSFCLLSNNGKGSRPLLAVLTSLISRVSSAK